MDPKQIVALNRRVARQRAFRGDEGSDPKDIPLFIWIGESDLYDWDVCTRALLKEIAYLSARNTLKGAFNKPKYSPFTDYEGWCYARQEYLAQRVGCDPKTAGRKIEQMIEDKVISMRFYETHAHNHQGGYVIKHYEYKVNAEMVYAHKRTGKRKPAGRKAGTKAFKKAVVPAVPPPGFRTKAFL